MDRNETGSEGRGERRAVEDFEPMEEISAIDPRQALAAAADFAREHPHAALGIAAGVGFLLGGGLTPRMLGAAAVLAGRASLSRSVRETLAAAVEERLGAR